MMHIQELETMARHGLNIMTVVLNDGGYGSEVHKLRASGATLADRSLVGPILPLLGGFGLRGQPQRPKMILRRPFAVSKFWARDL